VCDRREFNNVVILLVGAVVRDSVVESGRPNLEVGSAFDRQMHVSREPGFDLV